MKKVTLESKIDILSDAINILRKKELEYPIEILEEERSHYLFLYHQRFGRCYFEDKLKEFQIY